MSYFIAAAAMQQGISKTAFLLEAVAVVYPEFQRLLEDKRSSGQRS
jgi:hypothetical protein